MINLNLRLRLTVAKTNRSYGVLSRGRPPLQHLVHQRGPSGVDVQRPDTTAQRQRDQRIAARRDARSSPWPSAPSTSTTHPSSRADRSRPHVVDRGAVAPAAGALGRGEEVGEISRARDPQVLDRASRGATDRGRDLGGATLADDDAADAHALGRAAERAEVLRILDLVEREHEAVGSSSSLAPT
jgi:hypothetical protein